LLIHRIAAYAVGMSLDLQGQSGMGHHDARDHSQSECHAEDLQPELKHQAVRRTPGRQVQRLQNRFSRRIDSVAERAVAVRSVESLQIKTPDVEQPVKNLSGGNQQKVSIGKWLAAECDILIVDEPTVGVDVGAKSQIHRLIWDLARHQGKSVIVISSDLPELVRLVNRLLVFRERRIVGEVKEIDVQKKTYAQVSRELAPWLE